MDNQNQENIFIKYRNIFVGNYLLFSYESIKMNQLLISILRMHVQLRNLSYIFENQFSSYTYIIQIIARPTIFINIENVQYIVLSLCSLYLIFSQIKCFFQRWISIFGQLLYLGYVNLFFEISRGFLDYFVEVLLVFINILEFFILQGTLNFDSKTIFVPKKSLLELITICINILLMYSAKLKLNIIVIQIIAITNSFISVIYIILRFPVKNFKLTVILVSIDIFTIYLGLAELLVGQHHYIPDLVIALFTFRIIYDSLSISIMKKPHNLDELVSSLFDWSEAKQINVKQPNSKTDIILYASLSALKEKYYESLIILHSIKKLNWLSTIKKEFMTKAWLNQLDIQLKSKSQAESGLSQAVEQLTMLEDQNLSLQTKISNLIKNKCIYMKQISQKEKIQFKRLIQFIQQIQTVQDQLEQQFEKFPNLKTQNVLCFLYSEILNDFMKANNLQSLITKKDEKQNFSVFTNKMIYLILTHSNQDIIIKRASNNASSFFRINQNNLLSQNVNIIIPPGVTKQHMKLVKRFLNTGESKYMRKLDENYYQNLQKNVLQQCDFAIDVSFKSEEINFITFIQPIVDQSMIMILDQEAKITSTNENLLSVFNLISSSYFTNQNFNKFVPSFKTSNQKGELDKKQRQNQFSYSFCYENTEFLFYQEKEEATSQTLSNFITSFEVFPKLLNKEVLFYVIKFEYFKRQDNSVKITNSETNYSMIKGSYSVSENIYIDEPNDLNVSNQLFPNETPAVVKNENPFFEYTPHQTQFKENIQSSRPLFYQTMNKGAQSISEHSEEVEKFGKQQAMMSLQEIQEESSKISTLRTLRASQNFKKYEILSKLSDLDGQTKSHKIFLSFLSVCLLIQLAFILSQFLSTQQSLTNLIADIDLLQIKNFAFQPFESFLVTRWTIFNYNNLKAAGQINQSQYDQLIIFPRSNLHLGFDRLQENVDQVLNKLSLQQFLENTYLDIQLYIKSNEGEHFNVSLRNCITIMLNYQYITKMAYQMDGNVVVDSPHIYYQYRNYYVLKQEFGRINEDVLDSTVVRSEVILSELQTIFILSILFLLLFLLLSYCLYVRIEKSHLQFLNLVFCCQPEFFQTDIQRLLGLQNNINSDYNHLFQYNFNLQRKEKYLIELKEKLDKTDHKKFILDDNEYLSVSNWTIRIFLIIVLTLILTQASISYGQVKNYLNKYPLTAKFYKGVSDIGTDVPCVYAQSNILYGRANFPYYNQTDVDLVFSEITKAVQEIQEFTVQKVDFSEYFLSQEFADYYNYLMDHNLCDQLLDDMKEKAQTICPIIMNQGMQRGLLGILVYIVNYIKTEEAINQFTKRLQMSYLELEGAFLVSEIVRKLNIEIQSDLYQQTNKLISYIAMHSSIIIVIMVMFALFVVIFLREHLQKQQFLAERLLYLVPLKTLLFDDGFERNAKTVLMQESF